MTDPVVDRAPRAAVEHLLQTARCHLGMEAAFLAELTATEQIHRATTGADADSFTIFEHGRLPRLEGYCRRVMETDEPWVIRDTMAEPAVRHLAVTAAGRFGAYIGVPVKLPDGRAFGTLCCLSHTPRPDLDGGDVAVLQALADVLGFHVAQLDEHRDQLDEHVAQLGGLKRRADDLAEDLEAHELRLEIFQYLVDASPNPTLLLDPGTLAIVYANRAAAGLAGCSLEAMVGRLPWDLRACWEKGGLQAALTPLIVGEVDSVHYELGPSVDAPPMDVAARRVVGGSGGPALILWTGHDVTRHLEVEERLERALDLERTAATELRRLDGLRTAFLTAVSHELRTPLTTVRGVAELLQRGRSAPDRVPELLGRLHANAERLDRLLADLLDLNLFVDGSLTLHRERVRLDELIRAALAEVDLGDRELRLDLAEVEASVAPVKLERLVVNLAHNASVHTPAGTPVEVTLSEDRGEVAIVVSDHGPGVPPEQRTALFAPFAQGPTAPSHRPGTGIGLALVSAYTQLHGGRVWVEDVPGGGAAFHVVLPDQPVG